MIRIQQIDHVSMGVPALAPQIDLLERLFGFQLTDRFESEDGYSGANLAIPGRSALTWELLAPRDEHSPLHRFIANAGPGIHHIGLRVPSVREAAREIRELGVEPWIADEERDDLDVYLRPRHGGRGCLWQLSTHHVAASTPPPFEDTRADTLGIVAVNHIAHAAADRDDLAGWYERTFGCTTVYRSPDGDTGAGFRTSALDAPSGQLRFEVIEPAGASSFVARFLQARGESIHHVTFEVGDWERAVVACERQQVPLFGVQSGTRLGARWNEAFIHPQYTGGVLVQLFSEERPGTWI